MKLHRMRVFALIAATTVPLAACGPSTENAAPVDLESASGAFFQSNPNAAAGLLSKSGRGLIIYQDGKAYFIPWGAREGFRVRTGVSSMKGNEICLRQVEGWSGACIEVFRLPVGDYLLDIEFGNGADRRERVELKPVTFG